MCKSWTGNTENAGPRFLTQHTGWGKSVDLGNCISLELVVGDLSFEDETSHIEECSCRLIGYLIHFLDGMSGYMRTQMYSTSFSRYM